MRTILFCQNNYAFGILEPIKQVLAEKGYDYIWFITDKIKKDFPYTSDNYTLKISDLKAFNSDAIFVPGNEVPHYLRGLKVQVFHGLAGEKKGHFRIRHYFDLYLTQGPYFTNRFNELKEEHKNFDVIETGWPKLDIYGKNKSLYNKEKIELLEASGAKKIILYAPTFSPKLTSAPFLIEPLKEVLKNPNYLVLIKFHPLMDENWIREYKTFAAASKKVIVSEEKNIIKFLLMADVLVSDTSSVIYEFLLLDKPVITFKNISEKIYWNNVDDYKQLNALIEHNLNEDSFANQRQTIYNEFHPYNDGKSALRMVEAVENYIKINGIPKRRKISFLRRMKINSIFGKA
ncbi:CDP-glycerol glycerophosphotransferase family protein [uncultured Winogradskyella sp.]|uniref:CDP-glycerol glycerophosphotransferase family protein n=1 Tax=uncultured Winogradskyella sp. TaxID=395353 RepID=UPI0026090FD3|nr:CDP-glycerol glycerophosphotransferase family protein [uncultured Winogradskyella sp.]